MYEVTGRCTSVAATAQVEDVPVCTGVGRVDGTGGALLASYGEVTQVYVQYVYHKVCIILYYAYVGMWFRCVGNIYTHGYNCVLNITTYHR